AGDHTIADGEVHRQRRFAGGKLAENQAALLDHAEKTAVRPRIDDIDSGAEDGDGRAAGFERGGVRGGIDPARQPGDDHDAGGNDLSGEVFGRVERVG